MKKGTADTSPDERSTQNALLFLTWRFILTLDDVFLGGAAEKVKGKVLQCLQVTFKCIQGNIYRESQKEKMLTVGENHKNIYGERQREKGGEKMLAMGER